MSLGDEKYILLTTFRRSGEPVATPVWSVPLDHGKVGFNTSSASGKLKRIAHTPGVTVQPCNARGRTKQGTGSVEATAALATEAENRAIQAQVMAKYGIVIKITKLVGDIAGRIKGNRVPYGDACVVLTPMNSVDA